jgi:hypothetical protein
MASSGELSRDEVQLEPSDLPGAWAIGMSGVVEVYEVGGTVVVPTDGTELTDVPAADLANVDGQSRELAERPDILELGSRAQTAVLRACIRVKDDLYVEKGIRRDLLEGTTTNGAALGVANLLAGAIEEEPREPRKVVYDPDDISNIPGLNIVLMHKMRFHGPDEARRYLEIVRRDQRINRLKEEVARKAWLEYGGNMLLYFDATRGARSFSNDEISALGGMQSDAGGHILEALIDKILSKSHSEGGRRISDHREFTRLLGIQTDRAVNQTGEGAWEDRRARQKIANEVDAERDKSDGKTLIISENPAFLMAAFALPDTNEIHVRGVTPNGQTSLLFEKSTGVKYPPPPSYEKNSRQFQRIVCSIPRYYEPSRLLDKLGPGGMLVLTGDMDDDRYIDDVLFEMESRIVSNVRNDIPKEWVAIPIWDGDVQITPSIQDREVRAEFAHDGNRYTSLFIFKAPYGIDYRSVSETAYGTGEEE